jgi:hypothetical protein
MSTSTLVIKSVPKHIHDYLKESARAHRRSLTQEVITILENMLDFQKKEGKVLEQKIPLENLFPKRKFIPGYLELYNSGAFAGGTDSSVMISEDRDAR